MAVISERSSLCKSPVKYFPARAVRGLAITQIVFGCVVIIAQIIILALYNLFFTSISQGIWCGVAFVVCGAFGVVSSKYRTFPWVVTHLVLCIIICVFCAAIVGLSALTAVYYFGSPYTYQSRPCPVSNFYLSSNWHAPGDNSVPRDNLLGDQLENDYWLTYYSTGYHQADGNPAIEPCFGHYVINIPWIVQFAMNLLMGCLGVINAIVSIIAATLSCAPVCCYLDKKKEDEEQLIENSSPDSDSILPPYSEKAPIDMQQILVDSPAGTQHI